MHFLEVQDLHMNFGWSLPKSISNQNYNSPKAYSADN